MSNYKNDSTPPATPTEPTTGATRSAYETTLRNGRMGSVLTQEGQDAGGWDAYRRWLNRVQTDDKRRAPVDPALYTWKGYRNWSEKVRRDWKHDEK
jgi:hypothetical protein